MKKTFNSKLTPLTNALIFVSILYFVASCEEKAYKSDTVFADIKILGKENCHVDSASNSWIVSLAMKDHAENVGELITYKGVSYENVVKVNYDLRDLYKDSLTHWVFEFKSLDTIASPCSVASPDLYNIPFIKIKTIYPSE